jgi:N-dimethylarginine dimethylaminohydrolase
MNTGNTVDRIKAQTQYDELKQTYQQLGVDVLEISQDKTLPDMVYAANYGFPKDNLFIKSNFKHNERKKEAELSKEYLQKRGFFIKELPAEIILEGQGDLLTVAGKYYLGWGKRTMLEAKFYLSQYLKADIMDFKLIHPHYYHLDTCFLPLDEKTAAINPAAFDKEGREKLQKEFPQLIRVTEADNEILACNSVVVGKTIVSPKGISQPLKDAYQYYGFEIKEVPMSEFNKSGGAVKCLTLEFF